MAANKEAIANLALQKIGDTSITAFSDNTARARAVNAAYDPARKAELRAHPWSFAKKRDTLTVDGTAPDHGFLYRYALPADFIRLFPTAEDTDLQVEAGYILTNLTSDNLKIVYGYDVETTTLFDPLFDECLACRLAAELAWTLTAKQSLVETKWREYDRALREAKRANAFERISAERPTDDWLLARY